jgi:DNA (cytosine-5)-methyltransferase 1
MQKSSISTPKSTVIKYSEKRMNKGKTTTTDLQSPVRTNDPLFEQIFSLGMQHLKDWKPETEGEGQIDVLDFFSGCGGTSLGFAALSGKQKFFNIIGGVDINAAALKTFASNFKAPTLTQDIREIYLQDQKEELKAFFGLDKERTRPLVVIGCAPCQGFSAHTKKFGDKRDERNTLIGAFAEIVVGLRPDFIVMENVPEILGKKYQQHYQEAKEVLIKHGYQISQQIYSAAMFGVPQARNRAIIVASKSAFALPAPVFQPGEYATVKDAIGTLPAIKAGEVPLSDPYHRSAAHNKSTLQTISMVPKNGGNRPKGVGPQCLDKVKGFYDVYGRLSWDRPSITITQYSRNPASGRFTHPEQDRGLTIREAARIQSFPDGFAFEGNLDHCFKQIGEAVPPLLSMAIAAGIAEHFINAQTGISLQDINANSIHLQEEVSTEATI